MKRLTQLGTLASAARMAQRRMRRPATTSATGAPGGVNVGGLAGQLRRQLDRRSRGVQR